MATYAIHAEIWNSPLMPSLLVPDTRKLFSNGRCTIMVDSRPSYAPKSFIGLELSLVPEVETVFVELVPKRKMVRVITIINERDPAIRERVYKREQFVIDAFPNLDFTFRVIARMNRDLSEVVERIGDIAYQR